MADRSAHELALQREIDRLLGKLAQAGAENGLLASTVETLREQLASSRAMVDEWRDRALRAEARIANGPPLYAPSFSVAPDKVKAE